MSTIERIKAEFLADKRKAGVLAFLGLLVAALGVRAVLVGRGGGSPQPAASTASTVAVSDALLDTPSDDPEARFRAIAAAHRATSQPSPPARDLFALNTEHFPHAAEPEPPDGESAKSALQTDDETLRREALERDAESIRLKSTLVGERPVAVLDLGGIGGARDVLVRVGDTVNGFQVVRIEAKRVILERDGERIERTVRSPIE